MHDPRDERRYTEEEVARIFADATELELSREPGGGGEADDAGRHGGGGDEGGMTLSEVRDVGIEAGISPEMIARAAARLDAPRRDGPRRSVAAVAAVGSQPVARAVGAGRLMTVGRTAQLPAPLRDRDWERLVAEIRHTFHATGKTGRDGSIRHWRNGNLTVSLEPSGEGDGQQLRLYSLSSRVQALLTAGPVMFAIGAVVTLVALFAGGTRFDSGVLLMALGGGFTGIGALRGMRWRDTRDRQFAEIADSATRMALEGAERSPGEGPERREDGADVRGSGPPAGEGA